MSVEITNLPEVVASLQRVARNERAKAEREVRRAAMNVHNEAKKRVPVDTGRLRNSIAYEISGDGLTATVGTNVEYAPHVEFGARGRKPKPYLLPALEKVRPDFLARMKRLER